MHPDTARMYINVIRSIFTEQNYKKFVEMYGKGVESGEEAKRWTGIYHRLGRDKEGVNRAFELFIGKEKNEVIELLDKLIDLEKKKIEKLQRIRKGMIYKVIEKDLSQ